MSAEMSSESHPEISRPEFYTPTTDLDLARAKLSPLLRQTAATIPDRTLFENMVNVYAALVSSYIAKKELLINPSNWRDTDVDVAHEQLPIALIYQKYNIFPHDYQTVCISREDGWHFGLSKDGTIKTAHAVYVDDNDGQEFHSVSPDAFERREIIEQLMSFTLHH